MKEAEEGRKRQTIGEVGESVTTSVEKTPAPVPVTRRHFLRWLFGLSVTATAAGVLVPVIGYLWPQASESSEYIGPIVVGNVDDFPLNSGKVVAVAGKPVIIVHTPAGGLKAFSAICTHLGCIVFWNQERQVIHSPCHDGLFHPVTGNVLSGPPPRPLPPYELAVKDGKVYVGRPLGPIYST